MPLIFSNISLHFAYSIDLKELEQTTFRQTHDRSFFMEKGFEIIYVMTLFYFLHQKLLCLLSFCYEKIKGKMSRT